jgi:hypothetical protein
MVVPGSMEKRPLLTEGGDANEGDVAGSGAETAGNFVRLVQDGRYTASAVDEQSAGSRLAGSAQRTVNGARHAPNQIGGSTGHQRQLVVHLEVAEEGQ